MPMHIAARCTSHIPPRYLRTKFNDINFRRFIIYTLCALTFKHESMSHGDTVMKAGQKWRIQYRLSTVDTYTHIPKIKWKKKMRGTFIDRGVHIIFYHRLRCYKYSFCWLVGQPHYEYDVRANNDRHKTRNDRRQYMYVQKKKMILNTRQTSLEYRLVVRTKNVAHRTFIEQQYAEYTIRHETNTMPITQHPAHRPKIKMILLLKLQNYYVILVNRLGSLQLCAQRSIRSICAALATSVF